MNNIINLYQVADLMGITVKTLRRWNESKKLLAKRDGSSKLFYYRNDLEDFLKINPKYLLKTAAIWAFAKNPTSIPDGFYCPDRSIFKTRLSRLEFDLKETILFKEIYPLVVAITGEIGNNSFDHNLGNWPDINGIFFGYCLNEKMVILADRGQGILTTLKRVSPTLITHQQALATAFTKIISGRAPENRGNGLKFVKTVIQKNDFELFFQSGDAILHINKKNENIIYEKSDNNIKGCFAKIIF